MEIQTTKIKNLLLIKNPVFEDERGFFLQLGEIEEIQNSIKRNFVIKQLNHSRSEKRVLRGIHYENMDKLIYAVTGNILCVFVDLDKNSKTFGQHVKIEIGEKNKIAIFVPEGLGNSFYVIDGPVNYIYAVSKVYKDTITRQIKWDDIDLNIDWPDKNPIISDRDKTAQTLKEAFNL